MSTDSPDLVIAKRLLDHAELRGFELPATGSVGWEHAVKRRYYSGRTVDHDRSPHRCRPGLRTG
ncbi:MAG: hypothetical protein ACT4NY_24945 [Pseudonocardiales bacterium]